MFVEDLKAFHDGHTDFFETHELYLLRNLSKGRGVGFFEAGNFHPDFILWLLAGLQQQVIFVDPKGIREPRAERSKDPVLQDHQGDRTAPRRSGRTPAVLHRLEHSVRDDAHVVGHGEERDAEAAHPFSRRGPGQLRWNNTEYSRRISNHPRDRIGDDPVIRSTKASEDTRISLGPIECSIVAPQRSPGSANDSIKKADSAITAWRHTPRHPEFAFIYA